MQQTYASLNWENPITECHYNSNRWTHESQRWSETHQAIQHVTSKVQFLPPTLVSVSRHTELSNTSPCCDIDLRFRRLREFCKRGSDSDLAFPPFQGRPTFSMPPWACGRGQCGESAFPRARRTPSNVKPDVCEQRKRERRYVPRTRNQRLSEN